MNFMRFLVRKILSVLYKVKVIVDPASENKHGIMISNHVSFLDGLLLTLFLPQNPIFVVDRTIAQRWYFKILLKHVEYVTVDSQHPSSIKTLVNKMKEGRSIVIFPEGRITISGSFMKIYEGAAFVALKAHVPLIPIYLTGPERTIFSRVYHLTKKKAFPPITIHVFKPVDIEIDETLNQKQKREILVKKTYDIMVSARINSFKPQTLFNSVLHAKEYFGGSKVCCEDFNRKPDNYRKLVRKSIALGYLVKQHTQTKERVGILLPNGIGCMASILGVSAYNRIPAMLNFSAGVSHLEAAFTCANIKTSLTSRLLLEKDERIKGLVEAFPKINWLYVEDLVQSVTFKDKLKILATSMAPRYALPQQTPEDEAIVMFTSGSEGKPKGVVHSHASIVSNIEQLRAISDLNSSDRFMSVLPMFHVFGLTVGGFLPLIIGSFTFYYPSPLHYRVIPEMIYDKNSTVLLGTSTFLLNYAKPAHPYDFNSLRYVISGAERLSQATKSIWFEKFGIRILEGYGATELAPVIAINTPMNYRDMSVGRILPSIEVDLIPVEGIDNGKRLVLTGPNLMKGYLRYENPNVIEIPSFEGKEGWYDTGDIVNVDEDNYLYIVGRHKRFAKIAGEMVSLEVAEELFYLAYPDKLHAATVVKDDAKGEAIIILTQQEEVDKKRILEIAKERGIPEVAISRQIHYAEKIPLLGSGKPDYVEINKMATNFS